MTWLDLDRPVARLLFGPNHRSINMLPAGTSVNMGDCTVHATPEEHAAALWTPCAAPERPVDRHAVITNVGECAGCDLWREHGRFGEYTPEEFAALPELSIVEVG